VPTTSNDWDPVEGPDGAFVHVSDRAGVPELWISHRDGRATRLTTQVGSYVFSPAWSPDGQTVAFIAVNGRRSDLYAVARDGSRLQRLTDDGHDKRTPVFGPGGRIHYLERQGRAFRVMAVTSGSAPAAVPGGDGWRWLLATPSGALFGHRQDSDMVGALANGSWRPVAPVRSGESWAPTDDGLYILDPYARPGPALWFQPWNGPRRRLPDPGPMAARVTPSALGGATLGEALTEGVDLGLMRLGPADR
jgi:Tol biopolymer transport system component